MILALRTDKPEAELYLYDDARVKVGSLAWHAHRELSDTLLQKIEELLGQHDGSLDDLKAICVYQGPGSFTGLRIGITVANTLAYALHVPIVGRAGESWLEQSLQSIPANHTDRVVIPEYGSAAHITKPKK